MINIAHFCLYKPLIRLDMKFARFRYQIAHSPVKNRQSTNLINSSVTGS